ncbi:MAG: cellulose binding domain-containing protein [Cyanobacteria bacterium P01_D01_bin.44]
MAIIDFSQVNDWGSGFTASIKITNDQTTALKDWTLKFEAPFEITEDWGVEVVSRQGNTYTLRSADWATNIPPGQSVTFGFNANKTQM